MTMLLRKLVVVLAQACVLLGIACSDGRIVVNVVGDGALAGAELYVDGAIAGALSSDRGELSHATIRVNPGMRAIEVRKNGYETVRENLFFGGSEGYLTLQTTADGKIVIPGGSKPHFEVE